MARTGLAGNGSSSVQVEMRGGLGRQLEYSSRRNSTSGGKETPLGRLMEGGSSHNACSATPTQQAASATSRSLPEGTLTCGSQVPRDLEGGAGNRRHDSVLPGSQPNRGGQSKEAAPHLFLSVPPAFPERLFLPDPSIKFKPTFKASTS